MAYYNPYAEFNKIKDYDFKIDNQAIMDRFNTRIARETAERQGPQGTQGGMRAGHWIGAIGQLGSSLASASSNPYDFSVNNAAPFTGAAQGFATGGPVGAAIGAVAGVINRRESFKRADQNLERIDPNADLVDYGVDGAPTFNSQAAVNASQDMNMLYKASRKRRKGLGRLFAGHDDRVLSAKLGMKAGMIDQNLQAGRQQFNQEKMAFNDQQLAMTQYNQLMNNQNRMRNLYSIGTSLY